MKIVSMAGCCLLKRKRSSSRQGALSLHNERSSVDKPIQASSTQLQCPLRDFRIATCADAQLIKLSCALGWLYVAFICFIFLPDRNQIKNMEGGVKVLL